MLFSPRGTLQPSARAPAALSSAPCERGVCRRSLALDGFRATRHHPAEVALQHHERVDGGGYPQGLHGDQIDPVAQIVGICHLYLAAVTGTNYREAIGPRRAFTLVESTAGSAYDRQLVRTFARSVSPHPVGTQVRLANGDCGRVIGGDVENPQVEISRGVGGTRESRVVWGALGPEFAIIAMAE